MSGLVHLLFGPDIIDRKRSTRKGDRITLECGHMTMERKGDPLFLHAPGLRHPCIRKDGLGQWVFHAPPAPGCGRAR